MFVPGANCRDDRARPPRRPLGCCGLALLLVATRRELRLAGLVAWAAGAGLLGLYLAPDGRTGLLFGGAVGGLVVAAAGAWILLRWPWVLPFATLACIPIRIPIDIGDEEANLLLPLYAVIASLALALGWQLLRGDDRARELGPLAWPLAAVVAWSGLALLWTDDLRQGAIFLARFRAAVRSARGRLRAAALQPTRLCSALYVALVATALAYSGIGLYQWATREVFWNPKLQVDNAYAPFFRVNSVFWDPSIYGRYLVVAILATLALVLLGVRERLLVARDRRDRGDLARPPLLVLAVELRRAHRRHDRRRGGDLALARGRRTRPCSPSCSSRSGSRRRRCGTSCCRSRVPGSTRSRATVQGSSATGSGLPSITRSSASAPAASSARMPRRRV